jgi:hypothetical protein
VSGLFEFGWATGRAERFGAPDGGEVDMKRKRKWLTLLTLGLVFLPEVAYHFLREDRKEPAETPTWMVLLSWPVIWAALIVGGLAVWFVQILIQAALR